jgi:hypothetical protein
MTALIISIGAGLVSGSALFFIQRYFKRKDKKDEQRDKAKAKENVLILKSIKSIGGLTVANSIALKNGKVNGCMTKALEEYEDIDKELYEYLLEQNAKN